MMLDGLGWGGVRVYQMGNPLNGVFSSAMGRRFW